jgi:uncharacterized protein YndB with AHSA1/START domain
MTKPNTDRIEKRITVKAPVSRVWSALSDSRQFGEWFGVRFSEPFVAGKAISGRMTPTTVSAEVAKAQKQFEGRPFDITVETIEAPRRFSFRWHPYALDEKRDYSKEPTTLVEFVLSESAGGTLIVVTESGFDQIPLDRRVEAFKANSGGWEAVMGQLVPAYLEQNP